MTVLRSGSATHVGRVRSVNQDCHLEAANLFAVADGMGGHAGGEVAAQVAVEALRAAFDRDPSTVGLRRAVVEANGAVWRRGQSDVELRGMGTTLAAVGLVGGADGRDVLAMVNVGDSRGYLFSDGELYQVTADHSLAEEKVRRGEMSEAEAAVHPHRHILTRALGVSDAVMPDAWELHVRTGDRLLLCSDGLTNEVSTDDIARVLTTQADPSEAADELVDRANRSGGSDNITVVVVDVLIGDEAEPVSRVVAHCGAGPDPSTGADGAGGEPAAGPLSPPPDDTGLVTLIPGRSEAGAPPAGLAPLARSAGPSSGATAAAAGPLQGAPLAAPPGQGTVAPPHQGAPPDAAWSRRGDAARPGQARGVRRESRRERRRRLGVPRRVTFRVVLFFVLLAGLVAGAYVFVRWYAMDNWYVTIRHHELVIYQGRPGGLLWFEPKVVDRTGVLDDQVLPVHLTALRANVQEPTLADARTLVRNLHDQYQAELGSGTATPAPTTPSTTTTTTAAAPGPAP